MGSWMLIVVSLTQIISLASSKQTTCDFWWAENLDGQVADCSMRNLTSVPQDLPVKIVVLDLNLNYMRGNLENGMFKSYTSLILLRLSYNKFDRLEKDVFLGLHRLKYLDLCFTTIFFDDRSYPPGIFDPLKNLKTLDMEGSNMRFLFSFPCFIFLPLTKLTQLTIKTEVSAHLEKCKELENMKSLKSLTILSYIPDNLQNDTFIFLETVPLLNLTVGGILQGTEDCVFCHLKNLTYLQIESNVDNVITLKDVTRFLYGLANRNYIINEIDLYRVQDKYRTTLDTTLDRQVMGYLPEICVKRLDLSDNRLMAIKADTFQESDILTKCIEYLDLSRNYITFDQQFIHIPMPSMTNLTLVDLSQNVNRFSPRGDICPAGCPQFEGRIKLNVGAPSGYDISLPPKLEYLNLSKILNYILLRDDVTFNNGNNLRVLDLSSNNKLDILIHVQGLSSISYLDISGTDVSEDTFINTDLFIGVKKLIARESYIYPTSLMSQDSVFFRMMTNLTYLDLSQNSFRVINERTFSRLVNVVNFSLSGNQLSYIPEEVVRMPSLTSLDLSFNSINIIKKKETELLDMKLEQQGSFYMNIFGNTISCTCDTLDFIKWLHETRITLGNKGNYSCLTNSGTMIFTTQIYNNWMLHWRRCVGQFWMTMAVSLHLFMIICLLSAFLLKKYFPKVEHEILRWLGRLEPKRWDYEYDAYICYGDKDYRWPCHSLYQKFLERDETVELYVPDLHDPFGEVKAEVIHNAIKKSWKLIIVVTEDLFTDEWSNFKVLEALRLFSQEGVITSRIVLLYQDISPEAKDRVPDVLLNVVPRKNTLHVNPGDDFWAELHQMIISEDLDINVLF